MNDDITMREIVEQAYVEALNWRNSAVDYDHPQPLPDLKEMTDKELWYAYQNVKVNGAIG